VTNRTIPVWIFALVWCAIPATTKWDPEALVIAHKIGNSPEVYSQPAGNNRSWQRWKLSPGCRGSGTPVRSDPEIWLPDQHC